VPAQARLIVPDEARARVGRLGAVLSLAQDPSQWQDVTAARGPGALLAFVPHFSTIWIHDPTTPGGLTPICCTPNVPGTSPTSCILASSSGLSCDPSQCTVTPGLCGSVGSSSTNPCPCAPASSSYTYADCLTCDPTKCIPDPAYCAPGSLCEICNDPAMLGNPTFVDAYTAYAAGIATMDCAQLAVLNTSPPSTSSASWCYVAGAAKWCAFQEALQNQGCTNSPTTVAPTCDARGCCGPITPGVQPPGGMTCAQLPEIECEVYGGQGMIIPQFCAWNAGAMCSSSPTDATCDLCDANAAAPGFVSAYQAAYNLYGGPSMTCYDVWLNAPPPPLVTGTTLLSSVHVLATWCGHRAAAYAACGGTLGCPPLPAPVTPAMPMGMGPTPTTMVPTAVACGHCDDPVYAANPHFAAAYAGGLSEYAAYDCADLDALALPSPMGAVGSVAYATTLGRWCAVQKRREDLGCGVTSGGLPSPCAASCCTPITPGVEPSPLTCSQLGISYVECVSSAGAGLCAWSPTCPPL
jgi:hypothetical protein